MALWTLHISMKPKRYISKRVGVPYLWVGLFSAWRFILVVFKGKNTETDKNLMQRR